MSSKTPGFFGSGVYDPERRGVAYAVHVVAEGVRDPAHQVAARIRPVKQKQGTLYVMWSDKSGDRFECWLLMGSSTLQQGTDATKAVAVAARVPHNQVTYTELGGITCFPRGGTTGSPRSGTTHTSRKRNHVPHR